VYFYSLNIQKKQCPGESADLLAVREHPSSHFSLGFDYSGNRTQRAGDEKISDSN
jgi:hypothetical protein